jgi:phosphohistidine phosphatase
VKLAIIRHGQAGDRESWAAEGKDDRLRPLTPEGKKEMRRAAAGLAALVSTIDVLATSPLVRAAQTAEIVAAEYGSKPVTVDALEPDRAVDETVQWLKEQGPDHTIAVVGHEPHLSTLMSYLLSGKRDSFIDLKKGGVGLLELGNPSRPGDGVLKWLLTPRELRRLGK